MKHWIPCAALCTVVALHTTNARAEDSSPDATTPVRVTSDWPNTEVVRHLGTSYGTGVVAGRTASITTFHLEKLCRAPCAATLPTEGSYYVDAPGMHARGFELPPGSRSLDVRVKGASSTPLVLSYYATLLGGVSALTGGLLWGILGSREGADPSAFQAMTFLGGGVMVAGIAGLVLLPRTHVETADGARLDARASAPRRATFTGNGFSF